MPSKHRLDVPWQAFGPVAVQAGALDLQCPVDQPVPHSGQTLGALRHGGTGLFERNAQSDDPGHVFCAGTPSALLRAAVDQIGKRDAFADKQRAHALRPVELVRGEAAGRCAAP